MHYMLILAATTTLFAGLVTGVILLLESRFFSVVANESCQELDLAVPQTGEPPPHDDPGR